MDWHHAEQPSMIASAPALSRRYLGFLKALSLRAWQLGLSAAYGARLPYVLAVHSMTCRRLRSFFEGKEAIYVERRTVVRVRISGIRAHIWVQSVEAAVDEMPTPGLDFDSVPTPPERSPSSWKIGAGYKSYFSKDHWVMGYGGWSLFFDPALVAKVVEMAAEFPGDCDPIVKSQSLDNLIYSHKSGGALWSVFPYQMRPGESAGFLGAMLY